MDRIYDFSSCETSLRRYGGSDRKSPVKMDDQYYMLKYNDVISESKRNEYNSSYRNSAFSEYVACHIFESVGISTQETLLGYKGKKVVVACKDFCNGGYKLNEFIKYQNTDSNEMIAERYPEISAVMEVMRHDETISYEEAKDRFWDMFVMDALLGNFDRHTGNWGYLYNEDLNIVKLAPVYDCGACLYPMISDEGISKIICSQEEINIRIYEYPKAAFKENGKRIGYYDFLSTTDNVDCLKAVERIFDRIDRKKIEKIIDDTPLLSDIRREFYKTMISNRMDKIIIPSIHRAQEVLEHKISLVDRYRKLNGGGAR